MNARFTVPKMVRARTPSVLFMRVMDELRSGNDIHTPTYAANGELVLWVAESLPLYEYRLIEANDIDDLERKVLAMEGEGWDFFWNMVMFQGSYLQWMGRMREDGFTLAAGLSQLAEETA